MDEFGTDFRESQSREFSWERWLWEGMSALRQTLFRHDFGLPDEFWYHTERAAHEMLTAARILLRTMQRRRRPSARTPDQTEIDIEWD